MEDKPHIRLKQVPMACPFAGMLYSLSLVLRKLGLMLQRWRGRSVSQFHW